MGRMINKKKQKHEKKNKRDKQIMLINSLQNNL